MPEAQWLFPRTTCKRATIIESLAYAQKVRGLHRIHVKRIDQTGEHPLSIRASRTPNKVRKLLVIDDDAKLLASYKDLLSPYGFEVLTAPDGQDAIPLVEQNPDIQLVILDLAMPRMDGRQWLAWFRLTRSELPVIIISAYKLDQNDEALKPAVVLEKPFHVAELLDMVGLFCGLGIPAVDARTV